VTRDLTARKNAEERARQLAAEKAAFEASEAKNRELEVLAAQLQQQAVELEMQTEEAQTLLEEVEESNSRLIAALAAAEAAREMAREAEKKADEANRTKAEFLAAMSHELRTPLNAIAGHVELMALEIHGKLNESQHEALNRVKRAQQHLLRLIEDLLNFARIESGKVEYRVGIVVLQDALSDVGPMIGPQVSAKNLEYSVCMPEEPVEVKADREKLVQVILNLLSNAVKFTDAGGSIGVSVRTSQTQTDAPRVELMISDTGIGIPADKLETIFDPFVQLATSPSARHEGTGLGLTISRELTRGMGGDLRVESQLGQGTTFIVELPLAAREGD
jgi:signal transduction histidine kinase